MAMRVTGMYSGLDTETIIQELVAAKQTKVDDLKKDQTKLEWKQESWKTLNSKIRKLFDGTLSNLKYQSSYMKKTTHVSNSNLVSIITADNAMDSVQTLQINKMARAGYLTGAEMKAQDGKSLSSGSKVVDRLGIEAGSKFAITTGGKTTDITIDENTTISNLVSQLQSAGVKANFDAANQRLFIGADGTGAQSDFTITASNDAGTDALNKLGILTYDDKTIAAYQKYADMATNADAKNAAIDARIAELMKSYTAERDGLVKSIEDLHKRQEELVKAYNAEYAGEGSTFDITDDAQRAGRKADIQTQMDDLTARLEALKAKEEAGTLTDDEKTEKDEAETALNKAKGEFSFLDGYDNNAASITEKQARVDLLNGVGYLNVDADGNIGEAGAAIQQEAADYIQEKVDKAVAITADAATLKGSEGAVKIAGQDAEISLNGAAFTSASNTIEVNGLTITCKGETAANEVITLTTENDSSGIYDMIKGFIKEYSELINEMDKLYNAESSKGYDPLTDEEKDSMSDTEVEKWETKIKDSLLRRDSTLNTVASAMKEIMASGFTVGGKTMYLSDFGIETLGYFNAADNEKNAYHINGDADDDAVKNKTNDLMAMINSDPDKVVDFFSQMAKSLYGKMNDLMARTEYSSIYTVYDDKKMKEDYDNYKTKISDAEKKLKDYEDKWYSKFSAMETALAKLQSNANAVTGLLGGS